MLQIVGIIGCRQQRAICRIAQPQTLQIGGIGRCQLGRDFHLGCIQSTYTAIGTSVQPFISHVGMFQIGDGTVTDGRKHIVARIGSTHLLQQRSIERMIAGGSQQRRHRPTRTGSVCHNPLGIARHEGIVVVQIAHGSLQVKQAGRRTSSKVLFASG